MQADEAKFLLGLPPHSYPSPSQVQAAYKTKVWDTHPDLFPPHQKSYAEHRFKLISEAYSCLRCHGPKRENLCRVRTGGVPRAYAGRGNRALLGLPFLFIVFGTVALGEPMLPGLTKEKKRPILLITLSFHDYHHQHRQRKMGEGKSSRHKQ